MTDVLQRHLHQLIMITSRDDAFSIVSVIVLQSDSQHFKTWSYAVRVSTDFMQRRDFRIVISALCVREVSACRAL